MIDDIEIRPGAAAQRALTRREARDRIFEAATTLGRRHGLAGVASLRTQHTVDYITERAQGQAGLAGFRIKGVIEPFDVANVYQGAYAAGRAQREAR